MHVVDQRFADLTFPAATYGTRFMTECPLRNRPDQSPTRGMRMLFHADLISTWRHVNFAGKQRDFMLLMITGPADTLFPQCGLGVLGQIEQIREYGINPIPLWLYLNASLTKF